MRSLLTISVLLQAATLFLVWVNSTDISTLKSGDGANRAEWEIGNMIACDTYAKGHPYCAWRVRQLEDTE